MKKKSDVKHPHDYSWEATADLTLSKGGIHCAILKEKLLTEIKWIS